MSQAASDAFDALPQSLRRQARVERLGPVPALLIPPERPPSDTPAPMLLWMHGRTARKELDPGRYLRLMRSGIALCAVDLPGHGDRLDPQAQTPERVLDIVLQMRDEIDAVTKAAAKSLGADERRLAIGGMSAGGMAAIARLCDPHPFQAALLLATTGDFTSLAAIAHMSPEARRRVEEADPMKRLHGWRDIPVLAVHARQDAWIPFKGQQGFVQALQSRSNGPTITLKALDETGAPFEHVGFGRYAADVKEMERTFLVDTLCPDVASGAERS
ncbi:MAG: alpha/beta fold hydrolase [Phycisphaerales bacterium]|nr:alpha/beta fold hydrolase [Phycisphaerales bacterium]